MIGPFAYGGPIITAQFKTTPDDFVVEECLGYDLTGEGEHLFCYIEKSGLETEQVKRILARGLQLSQKTISYAGIKDKQAVTRQWFSIHLPGKQTPLVTEMEGLPFKVLKQQRHLKKLHKGHLKGNAFSIRLRELGGDIASIGGRIKQLESGVPNYFGMQRFGNEGNNLTLAKAHLLAGEQIKQPFLRGIVLSAARSWLFNKQIAKRVEAGSWNSIVCDDVVNLVGSNSAFICHEVNEEIKARLQQQDIAPSGVLWGKPSGDLQTHAYRITKTILAEYQPWLDALESKHLEMMLRPFVLYPQQLSYRQEENDLIITFFLPKGAYATSVIRELSELNEPMLPKL